MANPELIEETHSLLKQLLALEAEREKRSEESKSQVSGSKGRSSIHSFLVSGNCRQEPAATLGSGDPSAERSAEFGDSSSWTFAVVP